MTFTQAEALFPPLLVVTADLSCTRAPKKKQFKVGFMAAADSHLKLSLSEDLNQLVVSEAESGLCLKDVSPSWFSLHILMGFLSRLYELHVLESLNSRERTFYDLVMFAARSVRLTTTFSLTDCDQHGSGSTNSFSSTLFGSFSGCSFRHTFLSLSGSFDTV